MTESVYKYFFTISLLISSLPFYYEFVSNTLKSSKSKFLPYCTVDNEHGSQYDIRHSVIWTKEKVCMRELKLLLA